jgi:hypothetical protein
MSSIPASLHMFVLLPADLLHKQELFPAAVNMICWAPA